MAPTPSEYLALSAMITPALFMTADGSLIISTYNRMSRTLDRLRVLSELADAISRGATDLDFREERHLNLTEQLNILSWRRDRIRLALTMLYVAFASFVGTSLALALNVFVGRRIEALPTFLAVAGVALMFAACLTLVGEAFEAQRSNRIEVEFCRELHNRRLAERNALTLKAA